MPARNAAAYVAEAVGSVLSGGDVQIELVLVDDGSTDDTVARARATAHGMGRSGALRVVQGPRRGIGAAFNAGLAAATAPFVARCDADDTVPPLRFGAQSRWLRQHPEYGAVCGGFSTMLPDGTPVSDLDCCGSEEIEITAVLREGQTPTSFCTYAVRREILSDLGGCREFFETAEDIDLQLRLGEQARVWYAPGSTYRYRLHDASVTHRQGDVRRSFFEDTAREFARQRREVGQDDLERGSPPEPPPRAGATGGAGEHARGHMLGAAWQRYAAGDRRGALRLAARAWRLWPLSPHTWRALAIMAARPAGGRRGA